MSYILPINHEQYNQYANRVIRKDGPPFVVKPVQKSTLRAKLKGKTDYEDKYEEAKLIRKYVVKKDKQNDLDETVPEECEADITGKGKYINEVV
ncbi:MAG TPA: hypothetical protein GX497_04195 [Bacillus bacterium]|nr:hypothetical protein [Bacillus sp. (in: firmicutes)]